MKKITHKDEGKTKKKRSNIKHEQKIRKKERRHEGGDVKLLGHGVKKIIEVGNRKSDYTRTDRRNGKALERDEESEV